MNGLLAVYFTRSKDQICDALHQEAENQYILERLLTWMNQYVQRSIYSNYDDFLGADFD